LWERGYPFMRTFVPKLSNLAQYQIESYAPCKLNLWIKSNYNTGWDYKVNRLLFFLYQSMKALNPSKFKWNGGSCPNGLPSYLQYVPQVPNSTSISPFFNKKIERFFKLFFWGIYKQEFTRILIYIYILSQFILIAKFG